MEIKNSKRLFYHNAEWVLNHPRFGLLMVALIAASFLNYPWIATVLFAVFSTEIILRAVIINYKFQTFPYKTSTNRKMDILFLILDIIAVLSLLVTVFHFPLPLEDAAAARLIRAVYILRTLRLFRYIDLQSAIYSPTYGMIISLLVLLSFLVTGLALWIVLIFFSVELIVRMVIMREMLFSSKKNKAIEWTFWWIDLIATIAMIPGLSGNQLGNYLRALRLVRLFRPWLIILRNLGQVIKEGQYLQEINLIILLLAVLSIAGGVAGHYFIDEFDYSRDGVIDARDHEMLAHIWFSFRAFTDPGNVVYFPESSEIAIFSVFAVIIGVFVFAFFIGIGANIVSGLMNKLRNEKMNMASHMVMLGWNEAAPFVLHELRAISQRSYTKLKLVFLHDQAEPPEQFQKEDWVSFRWGDMESTTDLQRVNLGAARQVIVSIPDQSESECLGHSFFSLLAIREENPDVYISYTTPGLVNPRLKSHKHPLQVTWDKEGFYDKPTVIHSQADIRANLFKQVLHYRDFDQVMTRLMIPPRVDESALTVVEWSGQLIQKDHTFYLESDDGKHCVETETMVKALFKRGVILTAMASPQMQVQSAMAPAETMEVFTLVGIALDPNTLFGEVNLIMSSKDPRLSQDVTPIMTELAPLEVKRHIRIVIIGWVGALPLILKRLLQSYDSIELTIIDQMTESEVISQQQYLKRRIGEMTGAIERISFILKSWRFTDMDFVEQNIKGVDRIILSRPLHIKNKPHAIVASLLSDLMAILNDIDEQPMIFPVVDTREQALTLQKQLEKFGVKQEIHLIVPNEFYGTYVAHTSYHMFISNEPHIYEMHRTLRYVINDLMSDDPERGEDIFKLDALKVHSELPSDAQAIFNGLFDQGYLWIGYRMEESSYFNKQDSSILYRAFPREIDFRCLRQKQIIINPMCLPTSIQLWEKSRAGIAELIVIRFARQEEEDDDVLF